MADHDDDLAPTQTAGFKVGEKKTLEEYQQLGKNRISMLSDRTLTPAFFFSS